MGKRLPRSPASRGRVGLINRENGTHSTNAEDASHYYLVYSSKGILMSVTITKKSNLFCLSEELSEELNS